MISVTKYKEQSKKITAAIEAMSVLMPIFLSMTLGFAIDDALNLLLADRPYENLFAIFILFITLTTVLILTYYTMTRQMDFRGDNATQELRSFLAINLILFTYGWFFLFDIAYATLVMTQFSLIFIYLLAFYKKGIALFLSRQQP